MAKLVETRFFCDLSGQRIRSGDGLYNLTIRDDEGSPIFEMDLRHDTAQKLRTELEGRRTPPNEEG